MSAPTTAPKSSSFLLREIALLKLLDVAVVVLAHDEQVDQPHDVVVPQALELGANFAFELGVVEADNENLNWAECHWALSFCRLAREQLGFGGRELIRGQHALVQEGLQLGDLLGDVGGSAARGNLRRWGLGGVLLCFELRDARLLVGLLLLTALGMFAHGVCGAAYHRCPRQRTSSSHHEFSPSVVALRLAVRRVTRSHSDRVRGPHPPSGDRGRMTKRRSALVWALLALSTLILLVASMTVWSKRQLLDTDNFTESSGKLLANDEIRTALSARLVDLLDQRSTYRAS